MTEQGAGSQAGRDREIAALTAQNRLLIAQIEALRGEVARLQAEVGELSRRALKPGRETG